LYFADSPTIYAWNPLLYSDDAVLLTVKVLLLATLEWRKFYDTTLEPVVATCRAFTRAATEIGKGVERRNKWKIKY